MKPVLIERPPVLPVRVCLAGFEVNMDVGFPVGVRVQNVQLTIVRACLRRVHGV